MRIHLDWFHGLSQRSEGILTSLGMTASGLGMDDWRSEDLRRWSVMRNYGFRPAGWCRLINNRVPWLGLWHLLESGWMHIFGVVHYNLPLGGKTMPADLIGVETNGLRVQVLKIDWDCSHCFSDYYPIIQVDMGLRRASVYVGRWKYNRLGLASEDRDIGSIGHRNYGLPHDVRLVARLGDNVEEFLAWRRAGTVSCIGLGVTSPRFVSLHGINIMCPFY